MSIVLHDFYPFDRKFLKSSNLAKIRKSLIGCSGLINKSQSDFRRNDPCTHRPLTITRKAISTFNANLVLEVRGFFSELIQVVLESFT